MGSHMQAFNFKKQLCAIALLNTLRLSALVTAFALPLAGCGGGGSSSPPPPPPPPAPNASPGGIWIGSDPISVMPVLGLVAESGELFFRSQGPTTAGVYFVGQFKTDGNAINANVDAITLPFSIYPDRGTTGTGTLGGHIIERTSIDGGVSITTDPAAIGGGRVWANALTLTFNPQYNRASALATIAGNYGPGSLALTISSNGALFAQDASTGCVINGTVATIDTRFNMYAVDLSTMNCATEFGVPDGAQLHGLATLDNSQFPE